MNAIESSATFPDGDDAAMREKMNCDGDVCLQHWSQGTIKNSKSVETPKESVTTSMTGIAEESFPQTIKEIVAVNRGAAFVYPDGPPQAIAPPDWSSDGESEMDICQREFFLKYCQHVPDIPLQEVLKWFNCTGFMNGAEAAPWLPIWMCASFYAVDYLHDRTENVTAWAEFALVKCMNAGHAPVSMQAIEYFVIHVCDMPNISPELYEALDKYRQIHG